MLMSTSSKSYRCGLPTQIIDKVKNLLYYPRMLHETIKDQQSDECLNPTGVINKLDRIFNISSFLRKRK